MPTLTRRWSGLLWLLLALAAAGLFARLGWWQLDRAAQKQALADAIARTAGLPPLDSPELARSQATATAQQHRRASVRGEWLPQHTVYLDNRQWQARPGFHVLTPLRLDDGAVLLVQRGWVARDPLDRTRIVSPPPPAGSQAVVGRLTLNPPRLYEFAPSASGPIRQNLELADFAQETGLPLLPLLLVQADPAPGSAAADGLQRGDDAPTPAATAKHHGYAFQWFSLAALTLALYVWFQLIRPARRRG